MGKKRVWINARMLAHVVIIMVCGIFHHAKAPPLSFIDAKRIFRLSARWLCCCMSRSMLWSHLTQHQPCTHRSNLVLQTSSCDEEITHWMAESPKQWHIPHDHRHCWTSDQYSRWWIASVHYGMINEELQWPLWVWTVYCNSCICSFCIWLVTSKASRCSST